MYNKLLEITKKPQPFEVYTADILWTTPHIAENMLKAHLERNEEAASRNSRFIDRSATFIAERFKLGTGKSVIDFGCGPGLYTTQFARYGARVTGLDFSKNSLDYAVNTARSEGLDIDYRHMDYLTFDPDDKYDLVTLIYCDYCALDPKKRRQLLEIIKSCMNKDSRLFFDVHTLNLFQRFEEHSDFSWQESGSFFSGQPHFLFENKHLYPDDKVSLNRYTVVEEESSWDIYNWLQFYSLDSITAELELAGLIIEDVYANVAGDTYTGDHDEMALVCRIK